MFYKVKKKYQRGSVLDVAEFDAIAEAKKFIMSQLQEDSRLRVNAIYLLLEGGEVIAEFTQDEINQGGSGGHGAGGQQQGRGETFNPTPFNTAPRPAGMPHNWIKEDDKKKE